MSSPLEDAQNLVRRTLNSRDKTLALWGGFLFVVAIIYFVFSDGDFSVLLSFGALTRSFGFGILVYKMVSMNSSKGVSVKTLEAYIIVFLARLLSILRHQGYLPYDKTGDWLYHAVEILGLAFSCFAVYKIMGSLKPSYNEKFDNFGALHIPSQYGVVYLIVPTLLLACVFHPSLNNDAISDISWTFSMYLEAVAIFPQFVLFNKKASDEGGEVEWSISHYVFALGFSRLLELVFWLSSHKELSDSTGAKYVGWFVLLTQLAHLGIMADFFYYYGRSILRGGPMELPTAHSNVV